MSNSAKTASFWSPERGSRDQQSRRKSPTPLHAEGRTLTEVPAPVDLKTLHAKIGELTLENDFLSGALGKADLLSAKR